MDYASDIEEDISVASEKEMYSPSKISSPREIKSPISSKTGMYNTNKAANLELAKIHSVRFMQESHKIFEIKNFDPEGKKCDCCMFPITGKKFSMFGNNDNLAELGESFPLYFFILKFAIFYMILIFSIAGIACLIANSLQGNLYQWKDTGNLNKITIASYGNPWTYPSIYFEVPYWQGILHIICSLTILVLNPFVKRKINEKSGELDLSLTTPSDFTVWFKGLPSDYSHEELEEFLVTKASTSIKLVNIVSTYDIKDFVKVTEKILKLSNELEFIKEYMISNGGSLPVKSFLCLKKKYPSLEILEARMSELKKEQEIISKNLNTKNLNPVAFVTFRSQIDSRLVAKQWNLSNYTKLLTKFNICKKAQSILFKGNLITAEIAPEPSDVYWENLSADYIKKQIRRIITYFIAFVTISITFVTLFFIGEYQKQSYEDNTTSTKNSNIGSSLSSILVVVINILLTISIKVYSKQEMHHSQSTYNLSVANKLVIAMFLNTGIIPLVVNYDYKVMWFNTGGLANNIFWIQVSNAVVQPLLYLAAPVYQLKRIYRWIVVKRGLDKITQYEANLLFEGPEVDLAGRYANLMKTCIVSIFYAPLVPIGLIISSLGIVLDTLAFKYMLITYHSRPKVHGKTLALDVSKWLERIPILYSGGILCFYYHYIPVLQGYMIALLVVVFLYHMSCLNLIIESRFANETLEKLKELHKDNDPENDYYEQIPKFYTVLYI